MSEIKAVVFDMDGVILDSESICDITWEMAAKEFGIAECSDVINECRGTNKHDSAVILRTHFGQNFEAEEFLLRTSELFKQIEEKSGVPLMPYAKEILDYLKPKYRIILASSTRKVTVIRQLTNVGLIDYFETITTGDMVVHSKPDPEIYLKAVESIGLQPEECVAIEDSPNGVKSSYAAGIKTVLIPDRTPATEEIIAMSWKFCKSLKDLESIL